MGVGAFLSEVIIAYCVPHSVVMAVTQCVSRQNHAVCFCTLVYMCVCACANLPTLKRKWGLAFPNSVKSGQAWKFFSWTQFMLHMRDERLISCWNQSHSFCASRLFPEPSLLRPNIGVPAAEGNVSLAARLRHRKEGKRGLLLMKLAAIWTTGSFQSYYLPHKWLNQLI